jgi:hypothetical protein
MLCTNCSDQLKECANNGLLTEDQFERIADQLNKTRQSVSLQENPAEARKTFNPIMVVYYIGALLILSGFGWF